MKQRSIPTSLKKATQVEKVCLQFVDGRSVEGAVLFNEVKGCGKVINVKEEFSLNFKVEQIAEVRLSV
ncbi:MAG: hypothetical protein V2A76_04425 [Planctomycetota bacterium]